jgi:hypothetical protein
VYSIIIVVVIVIIIIKLCVVCARIDGKKAQRASNLGHCTTKPPTK